MGIISQANNHVFISGITRSGKSRFVHEAVRELKRPVLYMNIQNDKVPRGQYITVYSQQMTVPQLIEALKDGAKINLVLAKGGYVSTAGYIMSKLMDAGFSEENPMYLVLDECHLLKGFSEINAEYVSTAGLKQGIRLISVSQRPAEVHKTIYTQAPEQYIFYLAISEKMYMKNKGIDYDFCFKEWTQRGQYSYVFYNGYTLEGRDPLRL